MIETKINDKVQGYEHYQTGVGNNQEYFYGDQKTFIQELLDKIDSIGLSLADPDTEDIVVDGLLIANKNTPGSTLLIQSKISELQDLVRTIMKTFTALKDIEIELLRITRT